MAGKIRPRRVIMPSDLVGNTGGSRPRSGPVVHYRLGDQTPAAADRQARPDPAPAIGRMAGTGGPDGVAGTAPGGGSDGTRPGDSVRVYPSGGGARMQEPMPHVGTPAYAAPGGNPAAAAAAPAGTMPGGRQAPAPSSPAMATTGRVDFQRLNPQEQRQALLELVRDGRNDEEIGALFGLSQWQVRNLRYRLGIKKDRGGNVHLEPIRMRGVEATDPAEAFDTGEGRPRLALTLEGEFTGTTLASYLEGITSFVGAAGDRPFRVRCFVCEAGGDEADDDR